MKFGPVPLAEAAGAILAHSVRVGTGRLRKGRVLNADDLKALTDAGLTEVVVAQLEAGDVHEDAAALRVAQALVPDADRAGLRIGAAGTGRVNIYSEVIGVAEIDPAAINAVNAISPMITVATVPMWQRMAKGGMVATVKIISYGVAGADVSAVEACAGGALTMRAVQATSACLIQTVVHGDDGAKGHEAIEGRLSRLGVTLQPKVVVPHDVAQLATVIGQAKADLVLILTASATSDAADVAPMALRQAGGEVAVFGMPVDPGNLLFLGRKGDIPVIGLPGCARSPALNGADWVLERVACGVPVAPSDIAMMGVGGLLKDIPQRGAPRGDVAPG